MNCLKCGRETREGQVFCDQCLEVMEKYPVKPRTPVLLPRRTQEQTAKKPRRKPAPPVEEQMERLHKLNRRLIIALCVVTLLLMAAGCLSVRYLMDKKPFRPGQNYSPMATTAAPAAPQPMETPVS